MVLISFSFQDINGCLCINPGRLVKDNAEKTIARVTIQVPKEAGKSLNSWMCGQIFHI
jgi:hypothetical protein